MKKLNQLKMISFLAVGLLVPGLAVADYQKPTIDEVSALISPTLGVKPDKKDKSGVEALAADIDAKVKEIEKDLTTNKEEQKLRTEVGQKRDAVDSLKKLSVLPNVIFESKRKKDEKEAENLQAIFAQMNPTANSGVQQANIDFGGEQACQVDTQQFKSVSDQIQSEPFSHFKKEAQNLLSKGLKSLKEKGLESFLALAKQLKEQNKNKKASDEEFQQNLAENPYASLAGQDGSKLTDEERIAGLKTSKKKFEQAEQTWTDKLIDQVVDLVKKLKDLKDNKDEFRNLAASFRDNMEQYRRAFLDAGMKIDQDQYAKCKKLAQKVGRDNPMAMGSKINSAYQLVVAYHNGDANLYANSFLQRLSSEARELQCRKVSPQIDSALGANLQAQINQISNATDGNTLMQGAMAVLTAVGNAGKQAGEAFIPVQRSCDRLAKFDKKLDSFLGNMQQQVAAQSQQQQQPGAPRTPSTRPGVGQSVGSPAAHPGRI